MMDVRSWSVGEVFPSVRRGRLQEAPPGYRGGGVGLGEAGWFVGLQLPGGHLAYMHHGCSSISSMQTGLFHCKLHLNMVTRHLRDLQNNSTVPSIHDSRKNIEPLAM